MKNIEQYLALKQGLLNNHRLFQDLKCGEYNLEDFAQLADNIGFWVMSFQDILRINLSLMTDGEYYQLVRQHLMEDVGHEKWFLHDLQALNVKQADLQSLYSKPYNTVRDTTFAIMSEVFIARHDYERLGLILTLESAGHIFLNLLPILWKKTYLLPVLNIFLTII